MTAKTIQMPLSGPEAKLIYRLRQLRKAGETSLFMVSTSPLTLSVMGNIEMLEAASSGSGLAY